MKTVKQSTVNEMIMLVGSGDININAIKSAFANNQGRNTTATDAQLMIAQAATDDDDDDLLCQNILLAERNEIAVEEDVPAAALQSA
jgi:hypothetical protein